MHSLAFRKMLSRIWKRGIAAVIFVLGAETSAAQTGDIMSAALNFERTGVIYDKVVHIPKRSGFNLNRFRGRHFNLKINFTDTLPERHDGQLDALRRSRQTGSDRYRDIPLWAVAGLPERPQIAGPIHTAEELIRHSFRFKIKGLPIRLRISVVPLGTPQTMQYAPGHWAYVPTEPTDFVQKTSPFIAEDVDLSECFPETAGPYGVNKYLLVMKSLQPGEGYRIQISNAEATPLPQGIEATLRLSEPEIAK